MEPVIIRIPRKKDNYFGVYLLLPKDILDLNIEIDFIDPIKDNLEYLSGSKFSISDLDKYNPIYFGKYELKPTIHKLELTVPEKIYNENIYLIDAQALLYKKGSIGSILDRHACVLSDPFIIPQPKISLAVKSDILKSTKLNKVDSDEYEIDEYEQNNNIILEIPELKSLIRWSLFNKED